MSLTRELEANGPRGRIEEDGGEEGMNKGEADDDGITESSWRHLWRLRSPEVDVDRKHLGQWQVDVLVQGDKEITSSTSTNSVCCPLFRFLSCGWG